jgi:predicted nucleic acid-binding protein
LKILADANILYSALLYPEGASAQALFYISENCELVISDFNISELREVVERSLPEHLPDIEVFLAELSYEQVIAPVSP